MISVVLPLRDAAPTIEEALGSVLADAACDEVVAVDDGSRDDGPRLVERAAERDRRVVLIRTGGVGVAGALAAGVGVARGDLVARMDADDVSLPGRLGRARALLDADPELGAAAVQVEGQGPVGAGLARYIAWQNGLVSKAEHLRDVFVESPLCHPSVVMRRSALEAVGGYREAAWPEDYDLWLRMVGAGFGLAKVPEVLFRWRHRPGRVTFADPRCAPERLVEARARYLAPSLGRFVVWGAGQTGRRLARALEREGARAEAFLDIDPKKIGRTARGLPILAFREASRVGARIVVAVGARGARALVRSYLAGVGMREPGDFVCAA